MRPLQLTIEGLHSFKSKQTIDFTELTRTGLFGIFGETGSGKSTILDGITLALYGSVKRATNNTQGILNSQHDKLEVSFTFAIGLGDARRVYRVERSFRRNKERRDSVNAVICRLVQVGDDSERVICDGQKEVNQKILEIIGLNMADFTRSVVLPQGEFAQFLKLRDAERDQMIERVFALADYGTKLTEKVKSERQRLTSELERIEGVLKGIGDISAEKIAATKQQYHSLLAEQQRIIDEYQQIENVYQQALTLWNWQQELDRLEAELQSHQLLLSEIEQQKIRLKQAEAAEMVKPYYENYQKAEKALADSELLLQQSAAGLETVRVKFVNLSEIKDNLEAEAAINQPKLVAEITRLQGLLTEEAELRERERHREQLQTRQVELENQITILMQRLQRGNDYKLKKEAERRTLEAEIERLIVSPSLRESILKGVKLEEECEQLETELSDLRSELQIEIEHRESLEQQLQAVEQQKTDLIAKYNQIQIAFEEHLTKKPGDLAGFVVRNQFLSNIEQQVQALELREQELARERGALATLEAAITQKETVIDALNGRLDLLNQQLQQNTDTKANLQAVIHNLTIANYAYNLAQNLTDKDPCPVCGSLHHPQLATAQNEVELELRQQELVAVEELLKDCRLQLEQVNKDRARQEAALEVERAQQQTKLEKIAEITAKIEQLRSELEPELINLNVNELTEYLKQEKQALANLQTQINDWEKTSEELQKQLTANTEAQNRLVESLSNFKGQLTAVTKNIDKLNRLEAEKQQLLTAKRNQYQALQQSLSITQFRKKSQELLDNDQQSEILRKNLAVVNEELAKAEQLYNQLKQEQEQASSEKVKVDSIVATLTDEIDSRIAKIKLAAGDSSVQDLLQTKQTELESLQQQLKIAQQDYERCQNELTNLELQHQANQRQVELNQTEFNERDTILQKVLSEKGFTTVTEYSDSLLTVAERQQLTDRITEYEVRHQEYQTRIKDIRLKLGDDRILPEAWEELQQSKLQCASAKERILGEVGGLKSQLAIMEAQYETQQQYLNDYQRIVRQKAMADEIFKLLQGNAFVAYIAEEHMRYILIDASRRLQYLTNGRYRLHLDEKKDFIICDNFNGGLERPVTSLSGGETFLVSLSLALALSSKIQLNGTSPLEFFFLDEGFGTLDAQLLDVVMDSLERLQNENMVIGIISHVPELRNRIASKLIVIPAGLNGEGSKVMIERT